MDYYGTFMAGHNKWSQIKRKKAKTDAQKGKAFTKIVREISMAVREGGADESANFRLRLALQKAKEVNMPADTIKRSLQKATGSQNGQQYDTVWYEGYGPYGVALMIQTLTDNRKRTAPNLRFILGKSGGNLGENGSVSYLFSQRSLFVFEPDTSEDLVMGAALESGAEDINTQENGSIEVLAPPQCFRDLQDSFQRHELTPTLSEVTQLPSSWISLDSDQSQTILNLLDALDDDDDVQEVYSNAIFA